MNTFEQYLKDQLKYEYATRLWLEGYVCLRCDEYGILTIEEPPYIPWCCLCGKDPLFHGPDQPEKPQFEPGDFLGIHPQIKGLWNHNHTNKLNGLRPLKTWFDEIGDVDG